MNNSFSEISNKKKKKRKEHMGIRNIVVDYCYGISQAKKFFLNLSTSENDHRFVFSEVSNQRTWKTCSSAVQEGDGRRDLHAYTLEVDSKEDRGKCFWVGGDTGREKDRSKRLRKREEKG